MHHRKAHRKSRNGCKNCKVKRIKCDEVHPRCANCTKYSFDCDFEPRKNEIHVFPLPPVRIATLRRHKSSDSSRTYGDLTPSRCGSETLSNATSTSGLIRADSIMTMNTPSDRLLELRLMHHFTTTRSETYFRFIGSLKSRQLDEHDTCSVWMIDVAMSNPGVMDALLGFSAFNLRHLLPSDRDLCHASHKYTMRAIEAHTQQLQKGISEQNAGILFAGSITIAFIAVDSHQYLAPENNNMLPLHWFQRWEGCRAVVSASWQHLHNKAIARKLVEVEEGARLTAQCLADTSYTKFDFLLEDLDRDGITLETLSAYENNVKWLSILHDNPGVDYIFKFTTRVGPRFVEMLEQGDPRTLTIVGYFFVLLKIRKPVWWLPQPKRKEFLILMDLLPNEWKPRMKWAVKVFEGCEE
ncbi:uncharacterized protein LY89DRAFT_645879 [Mollisia scopiformis]|uniref:Zn(2)-C6 fungal-type domain-containing protein n=1 Tax=Mollisia scopiformis TaxID=149040 RepID=A0A194X9M9_MOLSC|nr:uncharacterized protein LY89DRAFT_645879 [Mollisia scopiformis]KUJ16876.1 hypothetical protein LY89DRAFT_645879 [Mollisia scopiformis]